MTDRPHMTDRAALARARHRATNGGFADFLHQAAADELKERLIEVNRTFTKPLVVTGFPQVWDQVLENPRIIPDTDRLEAEPGHHDLAVHAMALHWANDPVGQLIQMRRALQPDGLALAVAFGGDTLAELRDVLTRAEAEVTGGLSPRVAPMAEIRDLGALLQRAGFALPVADALRLTATYPDLWALMRDLRAMGETNALAARLRRPTARPVFIRAAQLYAQDHAQNGRITATFELIFLTGWAPHGSQQQPLRPGSAQMRLADALPNPEAKD